MNKPKSVKQTLLAGLVTLTAAFPGGSAFAQTLVIPGKNLTVFVDVDSCSAAFTWCSGSGSVGPAAAGNSSVVGIVIDVGRGGLAETDFSVSSITNPAPGVTPSFVTTATCAACFSEPRSGVYRLAMRPSSGNWGAGPYMVQIKVAIPGGATRKVVVPINIP